MIKFKFYFIILVYFILYFPLFKFSNFMCWAQLEKLSAQSIFSFILDLGFVSFVSEVHSIFFGFLCSSDFDSQNKPQSFLSYFPGRKKRGVSFENARNHLLFVHFLCPRLSGLVFQIWSHWSLLCLLINQTFFRIYIDIYIQRLKYTVSS